MHKFQASTLIEDDQATALAKISCMLTERAISFHTKPSDPLATITYLQREKVSLMLTF